jgi:hypothetical protein
MGEPLAGQCEGRIHEPRLPELADLGDQNLAGVP